MPEDPKIKLEDIIAEVAFEVKEAVFENEGFSFYPVPKEQMMGKQSAHYWVNLCLKVEPVDKSLPIKELYFHGSSIVKAGDSIVALVLKVDLEIYQEWDIEIAENVNIPFKRPHDFREKEVAVELRITSGDRIIRTERSENYSKFL